MPGEILGEIGVGCGFDNGEVVAINDTSADRACCFHEGAEVLAQLRRASGDVNDGGQMLDDPRGNFARRLRIHHLGSMRSCIDVAVSAGLIALAAHIDLEGAKGTAPQR